MVAGHTVSLVRQGGLNLAFFPGEGTTRAEATSLGWVDGAGGLPGELDGTLVVDEFGIWHGDGVDERLRVRVLRFLDDLLRGSFLDDAPQVHDAGRPCTGRRPGRD